MDPREALHGSDAVTKASKWCGILARNGMFRTKLYTLLMCKLFLTHRRQRISFGAMIFALLLVTADRAWSANRYLIGPATLQASSMPRTIADAMNPQGWVLYTQSYGVQEQICEIFLAKTVAVQSAPGKISYSSLKQGALMGVIHLLPEATEDYFIDFHNQTLQPGYYTMRYAVMPAGTYEHGTKPGDFVVLSPVSMDQDPNRILKIAELTRLGNAASGTDVAACIELVAPDSNVQASPAVRLDETNTGIFQVKMQLAAGKGAPRELPLAMSLLTPSHGPEGS
jgi:hypothetical protein